MSHDFEGLLKALRDLKKTEDEANKTIEDARRKADNIIRQAEDDAAVSVSDYEEKIRKREQGIRAKMEKESSVELRKIENEYAEDRKRLKHISEERVEQAISRMLDTVLETSI